MITPTLCPLRIIRRLISRSDSGPNSSNKERSSRALGSQNSFSELGGISIQAVYQTFPCRLETHLDQEGRPPCEIDFAHRQYDLTRLLTYINPVVGTLAENLGRYIGFTSCYGNEDHALSVDYPVDRWYFRVFSIT